MNSVLRRESTRRCFLQGQAATNHLLQILLIMYVDVKIEEPKHSRTSVLMFTIIASQLGFLVTASLADTASISRIDRVPIQQRRHHRSQPVTRGLLPGPLLNLFQLIDGANRRSIPSTQR